MEDRIAKERLNVILLVDASKSMQGKRIRQVDDAIHEIKKYLMELQDENTNVDFFITIIPFSTDAYFYNNENMININNFQYSGIKAGGWSNLHLAYDKLGEILKKESKGGIMPDFGGAAPIILLLTDGHPSDNKYKDALRAVENCPWYKAALRYGIAIELDDTKTINVLRNFVGNNGDVITCFDSTILKNIIKIIVLTASKVKSTSTNITYDHLTNKSVNQNQVLQQVIAEALVDVDSWEW